VEIFNKRNFTCDCGTTRFPATSPCSLRINAETNTKGGVHSETPAADNKYNQNFRNRFCGCELEYDPFQQKGTMFQCLGLGTHETGGCGEDWWHPGCVVGLGPKWFEGMEKKPANDTNGSAQPAAADSALATISEDAEGQPPALQASAGDDEAEDEDPPMPPGFPAEDDFEGFLCYKCVEAHPWIKRYAGSTGFLPPVFLKAGAGASAMADGDQASRKRKAEDDDAESQDSKRMKSGARVSQETAGPLDPETTQQNTGADTKPLCKLDTLPPAPEGKFSLFLTESFRENFCRCPACFPLLKQHAQLLEEEETYEPPVSEEGSEHGASTHGSGGSLYERGESVLKNIDRVRAIEGLMAYNHMKEKLKPFFQEFAESGKAISAEDIKEYFAKLRGDSGAPKEEGNSTKTDSRKEQSGY